MASASANLESARVNRTDARRSASTNLAAIVAASVAGFALSVSAPSPRPVEQTSAAPLAQQPTSVKIIDAKPRDVNCEGQTWPYLSQGCLSYARGAPAAAQAQPKAPTVISPEPAAAVASPDVVRPAPDRNDVQRDAAARARVAAGVMGNGFARDEATMSAIPPRGRAIAHDAETDDGMMALQDDDDAFSARAQAVEPRPRRRGNRHAPFPFPFFR